MKAHTLAKLLLLLLTFCLAVAVFAACNKEKVQKEQTDVPHTHDYDSTGVCRICGERRPSEGLHYRMNADKAGYTVLDIGMCSDIDVVIPATYNELPVTSIEENAFKNCSALTSVTIGNSVTSIGEGAFYGCTGLTSVTIGNSVTSIGNYAFYSCTGLTSITIGNSITSIGVGVFSGCKGLTSVTIPGSVTSIGDYAFHYCTNLTSVTIPDSVTSIGERAFSGCTGLTSVTIGNSVTSIGEGAFSGCSSLESITVPFVGGSRKTASNTYQYPFGYIFGTSSYTGGTATTQHYYGDSTSISTATTYYIPTTLKSVTVTGGNILRGAFYGCAGLTSITIPDSVTSIGSSAFENCTGLTSVTIGNRVTSIGEYAFYDCTGLTSVTFANTSGWYRTQTKGASSGTNMTVTNASTNATNLVSNYYNYYWYRK